MAQYTVCVISMDGLELETQIEARTLAQARFASLQLRKQALSLTADDLLQIDYLPADADAGWWAERAYGRAS